IGDMLIALKEDKEQTPHGTFVQKCAEALYPGKGISDSLLEVAKRRASNYMRLAAARKTWESQHPASLNEALKMIAPPKDKKDKPCRVGWAAYLADGLGGDQREYSAIANGKRRAELVALPGFPAEGEHKGFLTSTEQAKQFGDAYVRHFAPEIERPALDP